MILSGKMLGIAALLAVMKGFTFFFETAAGATPMHQVAVQADDIDSPINTVWVLVTAFLVFYMQAGFMALEGGVRPLSGIGERAAVVRVRHLRLRPPVLGDRVRVPVRIGQRLDRA